MVRSRAYFGSNMFVFLFSGPSTGGGGGEGTAPSSGSATEYTTANTAGTHYKKCIPHIEHLKIKSQLYCARIIFFSTNAYIIDAGFDYI